VVFLAVAIHRSFRSRIECAWLSDEFYYRSFERDRGVSGSGEPPGALFRQDTGQPVERIHDALARPSRAANFNRTTAISLLNSSGAPMPWTNSTLARRRRARQAKNNYSCGRI